MSVSKLPSGRYRAQTYNSATGRYVSSAKVLGLKEASFAREKDAERADAKAAEVLAEQRAESSKALTLAEWAHTWTTDPLYQRPKESTNIHNRERIGRFVDKHGHLPLADVNDQTVAAWISGARNLSTVPVLKAMFNDAASAKAGRLITSNPFTGLRLAKSKGRADTDPPTEQQVADMIAHAYRMTVPSFAAWLAVAAWTGMRPGEVDALQWANIDFNAGRIHVQEQWNVKTRTFELPKNGKTRTILLTPQARQALMHEHARNTTGFCFTNLRGGHWTPSSRNHHWDRVRALMGWLDDDSRTCLYLATRHFCGWYLYNVLELPAEDVAIQLGHEDSGELVRTTYGHRDKHRTLVRIEKAFSEKAREASGGLRMIRGDSA